MMNSNDETNILAETENLLVWRSKEDIGYLYHLELGHISLHLLPEEWDELVILIANASS